jgi:hypothetical protein
MRIGLKGLFHIALLSALGAVLARPSPKHVVNVSYQMARDILDTLDDELPAEMKNQAPAARKAAFLLWLTRHDQEMRDRLKRGEEDTLVNFLVFGTSFTTQPRLTAREFASLPFGSDPSQLSPGTSREAAITLGRVDDLLRGLANPGQNERLLFLAKLLETKGYHPGNAEGTQLDPSEQRQLKAYVLANCARVIREQEGFQREFDEATQLKDRTEDFAQRSKLYRSRGLSYDTSLLPNMAIEESLKALKARGLLATGSVHRAAVIGPGLDFTDKIGGYDFYPQQTIQCFALVDTLFRLGLARKGQLEVTTFDVNQRVNDHLRHARRIAQRGHPYVLQLPLHSQIPWKPATTRYWQQFGDQIGTPVEPIRAPALSESLETRAVRIPPAIVSMITPMDLDIVSQHVDVPAPEGFDLIIATNVFLYYGLFEQLLALVNTQSMLRPGGFLLSNNSLPVLSSSEMRAVDYVSTVYSDVPDDGDVIAWYQRTPK